jgi:hypothetical protein
MLRSGIRHPASIAGVEERHMSKRLPAIIVGCIVGILLSAAHAASADDPILGTWRLNVAKSQFTPGPGWQSQVRTYRATPEGVAVTWTGVDAKGEKMHVSYAYAYDGRDYPMLGSASYDTLTAVRIDAWTVRSEEKRGGKTVGIAVRQVSRDGKVLTITDKGTNRKGQAFSQLLLFDKQ